MMEKSITVCMFCVILCYDLYAILNFSYRTCFPIFLEVFHSISFEYKLCGGCFMNYNYSVTLDYFIAFSSRVEMHMLHCF